MTAFDSAIATIFADPNFAAPALWRAGGLGGGVAVALIWRRPEEITTFGERRLVTASRQAELRLAEAGAIAEADTIEVAGEIYPVIGAPEIDADRLVATVWLGDPV